MAGTPAYLFGEDSGLIGGPPACFPELPFPSRSTVPESFRGGCSFGAGLTTGLSHEVRWPDLRRIFSTPCQRPSASRGRDAGYPAPPARIRACAANALG